jgi:hypothetical protein
LGVSATFQLVLFEKWNDVPMSRRLSLDSRNYFPSYLSRWRCDIAISKRRFLCSSFRRLGTQCARASRHPSSWTVLRAVPMDNSNAEDKYRSVTRRFSKVSFSARAAFTPVHVVLGLSVRSSSWMFVDHFRTPCTILWHVSHSLRHHRTPLSIGGEFRWEKHVSPKKTGLHYELLRGTMFSISVPLHIKLEPIPVVCDRMTLAPFVVCYLYQVPPRTEKRKLH